MWQKWVQILLKWPHTKQTLQFGCLFTGAELSQQLILRFQTIKNGQEPDKIDWASVGRYAIWGFAIFPHILRKWYRLLDWKIQGKSVKSALLKTTIDQTFFPLPILGSFYLFLSALEGKTQSFSQWTEECQVKLKETLKARYCFMIPAQVRD